MQLFSTQEIKWIAREMARRAACLEQAGGKANAARIERGLCRLRSEQFQGIAERLAAAAENGDKRIAIR